MWCSCVLVYVCVCVCVYLSCRNRQVIVSMMVMWVCTENVRDIRMKEQDQAIALQWTKKCPITPNHTTTTQRNDTRLTIFTHRSIAPPTAPSIPSNALQCPPMPFNTHLQPVIEHRPCLIPEVTALEGGGPAAVAFGHVVRQDVELWDWYMCTYVYIYMCMYVCVCVWMCMCMNVCVCMCACDIVIRWFGDTGEWKGCC